MPQNDLEIRVDFLEKTVASLAGLPQQVQDLSTQVQDLSSHFLQLRTEVRADISDVRAEVGGLRGELHDTRDELRQDMASMHQDLAKVILANHTQMLTLHEDLIERITRLGEGFRSTATTPPRDEAR